MIIPETITSFAKTIIDENHNILNPKVYLKHRIHDDSFEKQLKELIDTEHVDYVLFSSRSGAETHIDTHLTHLDIHTFIIPIILPSTVAILEYDCGNKAILQIGIPVKINHQLPHSLIVFNDEPCVLVMASKIL